MNENFQDGLFVLESGAINTVRQTHFNEVYCSMEKTMDQLEEASQFAGRLLEHGNAAEVLSLRKVVGARLSALVSSIPAHELTVNLEFHTDFDKFDAALKVRVTMIVISMHRFLIGYYLSLGNIWRLQDSRSCSYSRSQCAH